MKKKIDLFTVAKTVKVDEVDQNGKKTGGSHLETFKKEYSVDLTGGEFSMVESDGTGIKIGFPSELLFSIWGFIRNSIKENEEQEEKLYAQQLRRETARAEEAELGLETARLRHRIEMTELMTELARKVKILNKESEGLNLDGQDGGEEESSK